jgi:tetratricopeptide (TPR) repeat protein
MSLIGQLTYVWFMTIDTKDPFTRIHTLLRQGKLSTAFDLLLDVNTQQINGAFRFDRNHAWYCVGDILYRQSLFDEAKNAFKKSIRTRPDDEQGLMAIGDCYDELNKPKLAERYYRRALSVPAADNKGGRRFAIILNLANALFDQGRMTEAIKFYKKLADAPVLIKRKAKKNLALAEHYIRQ